MSRVTIVRHSKSAYPKDALSKEGYAYAKDRAGDFSGYGVVTTSGKWRARQTARALGYASHTVDHRFNELEIDDVNEPTPHGYVLASHEQHPDLIVATADLMQEGITEVSIQSGGEPALVVSHNLAISALFHRLGGEVDSFENLAGLSLEVNGLQISLQDRI